MSEISVQQIPQKPITPENLNDLLARFCYKFPQYTFIQAKRLPFKRIMQMLKVARKVDASTMIELANIIAGPHTENGETTTEMIEYYKEILEE